MRDENTSKHDFRTVVGIQSIGDDYPDNEAISFQTSSVDGQRAGLVYFGSDSSGSALSNTIALDASGLGSSAS